MPNAPRWSVNDIVYLRESALLGFIENYTIVDIKWDPQWSRWLYDITKDIQPNKIITLSETELVDQVEALDLAIINMQQRLEILYAQRDK
jgi:hypothetical protein